MNDGKKFAYFLFSRKAQNGVRISNDEFLSTMRVWFNQLTSNGFINEMFSCMETALDVFHELRTEILSCTASILAAHGFSYASHKVYKLALNCLPVCLSLIEDFEQACNNCIQRWHFRMLNDYGRNDAFFRTVRNAIADGYKEVIDIGSGTGILSLFAAANGATHVFACEASDPMFKISQNVVGESNFKDKINLINKMSTDLVVGKDLPQRCSLVITEIFDCGLFGEGVIPTLQHAWKELLKVPADEELKPKVIPYGARIYAFLLESNEIRKHSRSTSSVAGLKFDHFSVIGRKDHEDISEQAYTTENLKYLKGGYKALSHSAKILDINFNDPVEIETLSSKSFFLDLPIIQDGFVDAIAVWFELQLDDKNIEISTSPESESCWEQAIYHLETEDGKIFDSVFLPRGCMVELKCSCNDQYLQIYVNKFTNQDLGSSTLSNHALTDCKCGEHSDKLKRCAWHHYRAANNSDNSLARTNIDSMTSTSENGVANIGSALSEANLQELTRKTKIPSVSNIFPKINDRTLELQELCDRFGNKNLCASKFELIASSQIAADRRKVARINDETYLQCYKTAISLAIQASELTNHDGKLDVLCYCSKMSLIPMLIAPKERMRIHVVCDSESRMLLEKTAKSNDIDLQQYEFYDQSLADVAESEIKFDIVVMEIVDENGLLCQRLFDDVILIRTFLLKENSILMPESFTMNGSVISSPTIENDNFVAGTERTMGSEIGKFINEFQVYTQPDVNLHNPPLVKITEDFTLLEVKLTQGKIYEDIRMLAERKDTQKIVPVLHEGSPSAIAYWFNIGLFADCSIDTAANDKTHWHQAAVILKDHLKAKTGEHLIIDISLNRSHVHALDVRVINDLETEEAETTA